jgi:cytochrome c oxidase assembly protein subunit 11
MTVHHAADLARANRRTAVVAALGAVAMVGVAFAAVPLYRMFCEATGFGGTTGVAAQAATVQPVPGRTIRIRFDANTAPALPWQFRPEAPSANASWAITRRATSRQHR